MIGKQPAEYQMFIFEVALESFIDMNHEPVLLSKQIDRSVVESDFAEYYCADNDRPSIPIRTMVGMMHLKNIYNLSDEGVVTRWMENPYMQYFTGEKVFRKRPPINPVDMTKFRKRIGKRKVRKKFCKRAGIEPVIGHLKSDHRMIRNYLKGTLGDAVNTMLTAAAYNMRHWMNKNASSIFVSWLLTQVRLLENMIFENENQYACRHSALAMPAK